MSPLPGEVLEFPDLAALPPALITTLLPEEGPNNAPTRITVGGAHFRADSTVDIGGQPCTAITVSPTQLSCTVPARPGYCGAKDVVVSAAGMAPVKLPGGFLYAAAAPPFVTPASSINAATSTRYLVSGDWNGDGRADFAISNQGSNTVGIYISNGDGTFKASTTPSSLPATTLLGLASADLYGV